MKKLQILIIGVVLLFGVSVAQAQNDTGQVLMQSGIYRITVRGADGGNATRFQTTNSGGSGATVAATFSLQAGDVLRLVQGISGAGESAGGGGSAVVLMRNGVSTLLIVAGAGGGAGSAGVGGGGNSAQGTPGGGSSGGIVAAGGGGGFNANGGDATAGGGGGKAGTVSGGGAGGNGGIGCGQSGMDPCGNGGYGFGGGGGGGGSTGGGGGGYGGGNGNGGNTFQGGGGGSSYVDTNGFNVTRTDGVNGGGTNQDGSISIAGTTAASVSISGRVLTETKRGLMNVVIYLTEADGTVHQARTNAFGYYRFADILAGQTVVITVISKRYRFTPQVVSVSEEISSLNFVSEH